ncbi:MAG: cyclic nucleotide-binding domain-containing protein [Verrucomicrobiota bacterium]
MIDIDCECHDLPIREFAPGEVVIEEGSRSGCLLFMKSGCVEVSRDGVVIGEVSEKGEVIGEISILLDRPHIARVEAKEASVFHVAEDAEAFLQSHPAVNLYIARSLAKKVDSTTCYIADLKRQFAGEEGHLGMVHEVLDSLVNVRH